MAGCEWIPQLGWEESSLGSPRPTSPFSWTSRLSCEIPSGPAGYRGADRHPLRTQAQKVSARALHRWSQDRAGQGLESLTRQSALRASGVCLWACVRGMGCESGREGSGPALLIFSTDELYVALGSCPHKTQQLRRSSFPWLFLPLGGSGCKMEAESLGGRLGEHDRVGLVLRGDMAAARVLPDGPEAGSPDHSRPRPAVHCGGRQGTAALAGTGEGRLAGYWVRLDREGRGGIGANVPAPEAVCSQCTSWHVFMACPFPFSKLKMIVAVLISLPTQGPVSAHLLSPLDKRLLAQRNCLLGFLGDSSQSNTSNCWEEKLSLYGFGFSGWGLRI